MLGREADAIVRVDTSICKLALLNFTMTSGFFAQAWSGSACFADMLPSKSVFSPELQRSDIFGDCVDQHTCVSSKASKAEYFPSVVCCLLLRGFQTR
jgi:hypothetical protein